MGKTAGRMDEGMTESDHRLMQLCAEGDTAAFQRLVQRWQPRIARLLDRLNTARTRRGPIGVDVEDLAQEVFLKVLKASRRYRDTNEFSTWLYRIAINVARDAGRRQRTRWNLWRSTPPPVRQVESPVDAACRQELRQHVAEVLSNLPEKYREPVVLRHFGQLTFAQVAEVLGLPESTVKSRIQTGLLKVRTELVQRGITERDLS